MLTSYKYMLLSSLYIIQLPLINTLNTKTQQLPTSSPISPFLISFLFNKKPFFSNGKNEGYRSSHPPRPHHPLLGNSRHSPCPPTSYQQRRRHELRQLLDQRRQSSQLFPQHSLYSLWR